MAFLFFESIPLTSNRYSLATLRILISFIIEGKNTLHKPNGFCLHNGDKSIHIILNLNLPSYLFHFILWVCPVVFYWIQQKIRDTCLFQDKSIFGCLDDNSKLGINKFMDFMLVSMCMYVYTYIYIHTYPVYKVLHTIAQ